MAVQRKILEDLLQNIVVENNLEDYTISIEELSSGGANYTSIIYRIIITSKNKKDLDLFAKVANLSDASRKEMPVHLFFQAEYFVYHELVRIYNNIQEKNNVPTNERFKFPKFYGSNGNVKEETIVLENLVGQGYTMYDRHKPITWEYASKAVEELAKFHALSYAYEHENPDEFKKISEKLSISNLFDYDVVKMSFRKMAEMTYGFLSDDHRRRLEKFVEKSWTRESFVKDYGPGKWPVLAHGDFRSSNILHKCRNEEVISLVPIDYQTLRLSAPATDLLYFIYSGSDNEFREKHLKSLLDHYYKTLCKFLEYFNLDPDSVLSRDNLDEDIKDKLGHGLCSAIFTLPIVLVDADKAPNMSDEGASLSTLVKSVKPNEPFKQRFIPIVQDFINYGVI